MHRQPENAARRAALRWCDQATDAAIAWTLLAAPLCFGGRHGLGRLLYAGGVALGAIAMAIGLLLRSREGADRRATRRRPRLMALLAAAVAVPLAQLAPLPAAVFGWLAPAVGELAPAWRSAAGFPVHLGQWQTVSLTPWATKTGAALLVCHALLLLVVLGRLRDPRDVRRLLRLVAIAAAAMATLGVAQWLTSNGKLLWVYQHPQRQIGQEVQGAFANKNHFAHFVLLGLAPLAWAAFAKPPKPPARRRRPPPPSPTAKFAPLAWRGALVVGVAAVLMSLSRGAVLAGVGAGLVVALAARADLKLRRNNFATIAGVALAVLLAVSLTDLHRISERFASLGVGGLGEGGVIEAVDGAAARREVWRANAAAAAASPWLGFGAGSHADIYRAFIRRGFDHEFTHAESGYLQLASETGVAGLAVLAGFIALVGAAVWRGVNAADAPRRRLAAVAAFGLLASLIHAAVDFVWYLPACLSMTLMLAACAIRLAEFERPAPQPAEPEAATPLWRTPAFSQAIAAPGLAGIALLVLWGPGLAAVSWDHYLLASREERGLSHAAVADRSAASDNRRDRVALNQQMIAALDRVLCHHPDNARARLRMAGRLLQAFEFSRSEADNAMSLAHLRGAALDSRFATRAATVEWLKRAFGEESRLIIDAHYHAAAAAHGAPLQSDAYGYLADLAFLSPPGQRDAAALVAQAVRVDPHDGGVLFVAGKHAMLAGEAEAGLDYWRRAHRAPGRFGLRVYAQLGHRVAASEYLETFRPGLDVVRAMHREAAKQGDSTRLETIAAYAQDLAANTAADAAAELTRSELAEAWWVAGDGWLRCGDAERALPPLKKAVDMGPHNYGIRRTLAEACCEAGRREEAGRHLRWCQAREPGDALVTRLITQQARRGLSPPPPARQAVSEGVGHHRGDLVR